MSTSRPRPYAPPPLEGAEGARFDRAQARVLALTAPDEPDWRVLPKWQRFHRWVTPAERRELVRVGAWARARGGLQVPGALWRVVRVERVPARWQDLSALPPARLLRAASGLRSWSRDSEGLAELFGSPAPGEVTLTFLWNDPPPSAVRLDGDGLEAVLRAERPALFQALRRASSRGRSLDDRAGLDEGECLVQPPPLRVVDWTTERFDEATWHEVEVARR